MPPKPKFTKDDIIKAALDIIRESSIESITAQSIANKLNTSTRPMFNYFKTLEELRNAATVEARNIYDSYAKRGLSMNPSFKGFAMEYIRFAMEEPSLFRLLFMRKAETANLTSLLEKTGHLETVLDAVAEIFNIDRIQAMWLYENLWLYAHGIAALCASEVMKFSDEDIAEKLGVLCRGLVISIHSPKDERTKIIPNTDRKINGNIEDYILLNSEE